MVCNKCGANNADGAKFCVGCGQSLENNEQTAANYGNAPASNAGSAALDLSGAFVDKNEVLVASLKNGLGLNMISGEGFKKEDAFITNKRFYYHSKKGIINRVDTENIVELKDINATRFVNMNPFAFIIYAIISFVLLLIIGTKGVPALIGVGAGIALIFVVLFLILKKKFFCVEYAGGKIMFSVKGYSRENIEAFQKAIHYYKTLQ